MPTPRLRWVEDHEADDVTATAFAEVRQRRSRVPPVMRTMSLRPDVMVLVARLADAVHFSDGYLDRRTKEKIATYVSAVNACGYCATSHRVFLETAGEPGRAARAIEGRDLDGADLDEPERKLLELVGTQTRDPGAVTDAQVEELRALGWSDEQLVEALIDSALFNFFNRMVESFGLTPADFVPVPPADPPPDATAG